MPRPSRHLDRALLAAGRELLPVHGLSGLTIRQVCEAAGVNIGMFHYHFRTRETYLKALLQGAYEEMFSTLSAGAYRQASWSATLRTALGVLGRFLLANRTLMARVLAEALAGNVIARSFLQENFPRHLRLITGMLVAGQAAGEFRPMAPMPAFALLRGARGLGPRPWGGFAGRPSANEGNPVGADRGVGEDRVAEGPPRRGLEVAMGLEMETERGVRPLVGRDLGEHLGGVVERGLVGHVRLTKERNGRKSEIIDKLPKPGRAADLKILDLRSAISDLGAALRLLLPASIFLQFQVTRFDQHAGHGGMGAEQLEARGVDFPRQGGAGFCVLSDSP